MLGTDQSGRDELSRLIYGARVSLWVGIAPIGLAVLVGGAIGLGSAYVGGAFDSTLQRAMDGAMAFPPLILLLVVVSLMGVSLTAIVLALSFVFLPMINRVARASTVSVMALPFIESARAVGASPARIMLRYVIPNIAAPVVVVGTSLIGTAILAEASLSFLGFGLAPPQPTWGNMLSGDNRDIFQVAPWLAISPGVAIAVTVLAFNLIGDGLRDLLDPYGKGGRTR
jgi:peptide/nickel transport system permease protein